VSNDSKIARLEDRVDGLYVKTRPRSIRVKLLSPTAKAPQYMTAGAAGADVFVDFGGIRKGAASNLESWAIPLALSHSSLWTSSEDGHLLETEVASNQTVRIPLGIALEIPEGWVGVLKSRSGLATKGHEGHLAYIDSDYRGAVAMILHVGGWQERLVIRHGDRIGQIAFMPAPQFEIVVAEELSETARGSGGFGSSGVR